MHLIFSYVKPLKINLKSNEIIIKPGRQNFGSDSLLYIMERLKFLIDSRVYLSGKIVTIDLRKVEFFNDKITYLVFDSILHDLIVNMNFKIRIAYSVNRDVINHSSIEKTAFHNTKMPRGYYEKDSFDRNYKRFSIERNYYRRYYTYDQLSKNDLIPSRIMTEVSSFFNWFDLSEDWIDSTIDVIAELVTNVQEHTNGDCLVEINVDEVFESLEGTIVPHYAINIAVMNFSDNKLFDNLKDKFNNNYYRGYKPRYEKVYEALSNHKPFFNEMYTEDDFYLITAFQDQISSRVRDNNYSGGKGLTKLITEICGKTRYTSSYVLSGENLLFFIPEFLRFNSEGFIGFNHHNNYESDVPDIRSIDKSKLYIPGTIFNLVLIKEMNL